MASRGSASSIAIIEILLGGADNKNSRSEAVSYRIAATVCFGSVSRVCQTEMLPFAPPHC